MKAARQSLLTIVCAAAISLVTVATGYIGLGFVAAFLFTFGFVGGLVAWLIVDARPAFVVIRWPYLATLALFVVHKLEERYFDFFPALSQLTGVPVPETNSPVVYVLYGSAALWLLIPLLVGRRIEFGYYLAWTFFVSMGTTELAHFVFPFFTTEPYGYFPGMTSAAFLVPAAWWGTIRLARSNT